MAISLRCAWKRNGSVLLWTLPLLLGPLLSLHGDAAQRVLQVVLVIVMAGAALAAVLASGIAATSRRSVAALGVLVAATVAGATQGSDWLPTWLLVALTLPSALRGRWLLGGIPLVAAGSMLAAWYAESTSANEVWTEGFVVLLAGVANSAVLRLIETVEMLRRTREELARRAVADERERFSQDLHDLLGHTLSTMVVKAEAVRRLVERDPAAAAEHASDIESIGREALVEVREAVDATRVPTLEDELAGARHALDAAGIRADVSSEAASVPAAAEQVLAWVVREGATNVLQHSGAQHCRFELRDRQGELTLTVSDDGVGGPAAPGGRRSGLDGLRRRLLAVGGRLDVEPSTDGFRLTARVPVSVEQR